MNFLKTDSSATTVYYEFGGQVWPCRCGEIHRGEYGKNDYLMHECFHDEILMLGADSGVCTSCGKPVAIVRPDA